MRSLLSRLAFWWAALAVGLCLLLPAPLGTWVAALAVASAALSLALGRAGKPFGEASGPLPAAVLEDAGLLETAAMVVRRCAHAHDLPEALHGVARVLFKELGAEGLVTGRLDDGGGLARLDRFADPAARVPPAATEAPHEGTPVSVIAVEAAQSRRIVVRAAEGVAVPVLRDGRTVAWLEFKRLETAVGANGLQRLLELILLELSAVAERSGWHAGAKFVGSDDAAAWRQREAANAPTLADPAARRPRVANQPSPVLTRYPQRRRYDGAQASDAADVLDPAALDRLRELDPSGVNRVLERVVRAFEASASRLIPQLREGARAGDLNGVKQVAHTLRSASASVGAVKLSRLCADMESQARAEDGTDLAARVKSMVGEIDIVLSVLRSLPAPRT